MSTRFSIPAGHPAFEGHFPGRPIVPAVVLLAEALAPLELAGWTLSSAKFLAPVTPGEALTLRRDATADRCRFEIHAGDTLVATGALAKDP